MNTNPQEGLETAEEGVTMNPSEVVTLQPDVEPEYSSEEVVDLELLEVDRTVEDIVNSGDTEEVVLIGSDAAGASASKEVVVVESDLLLSNPESYDENNIVFPAEEYSYDEEVLTHGEARTLTDNIKSTANLLYLLLSKAYKGRAWIALGHSNFEEYVRAEFSISRSRAYQLLNQAKVIEEIESVVPEGTKVEISEASARDLRAVVDELTPKIKKATTNLSPEEAEEVVDKIVSETRKELSKEAQESKRKRDILSKIEELESSRLLVELEEQQSGGTPAPHDGEVDFPEQYGIDPYSGGNPMPPEVSHDTGPKAVNIEYLEKVYLLYSTLGALNDFPDPVDIVNSIPPDRYELISRTLPDAVNWLNGFNKEWNNRS